MVKLHYALAIHSVEEENSNVSIHVKHKQYIKVITPRHIKYGTYNKRDLHKCYMHTFIYLHLHPDTTIHNMGFIWDLKTKKCRDPRIEREDSDILIQKKIYIYIYIYLIK